jgi:benzoate-CoA ligase family protein
VNPRERCNVSTLIDANLDAGRGPKVAIDYLAERITYAELYGRICGMARALRIMGVEPGDRVILVLNDTPAFPISFFGAIRVGAIPVPVNPQYRDQDYRFLAEDTAARFIMADAVHLEKLRKVIDRVPVIEVPDAGTGDLPPADTHRDDMAFWLYSGGSTGRPKAVIHLQHDIPCTCETYARHVLGIVESDIVFGRVLFHAYGLGASLSFPFSVGASTVLYPDRPSPTGLLRAIEHYRPTLFFSVPTLYNAILNDPAHPDFDLSSLRMCLSAAEPLPSEIWRRWKEAYHLEILDGIGSTEMLHVYCSNRTGELRPGSTGKPVPGYELRRVDYEGHQIQDGSAGILEVKGESSSPGYWRQEEKTRQTMRGDWVVTGDLYRVDEDGFYWYEGRADDMIKVGGEWVSPIEMENVLIAHPAVDEVAVVGIAVEGIMRVRAVVVPTCPGSESLTSELQQWCKDRLQRYQYPHRVDYVSELPKTATGKLQRYRLRSLDADLGV